MSGRIPLEVFEELEKDDSLVPEARIFYKQRMEKNETDPKAYAAFVAAKLKEERAEKKRKKICEREDELKMKKNVCNKAMRSTKVSLKHQSKKTELLDSSLVSESSSKDYSKVELPKETREYLRKLREDIERDCAKVNEKDDDDSLPEIVVLEGLDAYDPHVDDINVKVRIRGKILVKSIRRVDKLVDVFTLIAKEHSVPVAHIIIYFKNLPVDINDTPKKLGMSCADILECVIIDPTKVHNKNCIKIKLQSKNSKVKTELLAHKLDPLSLLMKTYSEQKDLPLDQLIFEFDGERISPEETPNDLDIDDGCVIDVRVKK